MSMFDGVRQFRFMLLLLALVCCLSAQVKAEEKKDVPPVPAIPIAGPPAKLAAVLDPASAAVGDTVALTLSYTLPAGCNLPEKPEIEGIADLGVIDLKATPESISLRFINDSLTDLALGPFGLICQDATGARQKIVADRLTLKVTSNLDKAVDQQQLKPIFDIIPAYPVWLPWLLWGGLVVVILLIIIGLVWWQRRRASLKAGQVPLLSPHIRAQQELEALNIGGLFEKGDFKAYYFRFSEILKRYLEELRGFPAAEFTTEEIAARIHTEIDRELVVLLKRTDLVKFADDIPTSSRKDDDMKSALAYIATTAPRTESFADTGTGREARP